MAVEIRLPQRGMGRSEATITHWHKAEGDLVEEGEVLVEYESSKVTEELRAPARGLLSRIFYHENEEAEVGEVLALIVSEDEAGAAASSGAPPMRKAAASQEATAAEAPARREVPLTSIRRHTAQRMIESLHTTAQLTLHTEVDVTATVDQHDARKADSRVTYTAILVKIVAAALQNHPLLNAVWNGESIILPGQINIGVAVALDQGLVVPVIRAADQKSLRQVHSELERLVEQARVGTLVPDDLADGTFTITHLGSYRVDAFTPILNPPQTAILGVGRIRKKPAAHNDTIALRPMMGLSLTFDHRVVDGAMSAAFLDQISLALEDARF